MGLVVCFAGLIGSGKSSVSHALAVRLGWSRTGFGDFLRAELVRRGRGPATREALQDLGQSMVDADPEGFCRAVLAVGGFVPGSDLLVDGVRHVNVQYTIARIVRPSTAKLIFLAADDANRFKRVGQRSDGHSDFARAESHRVEADLRENLPNLADAVIDARNDLPIVLSECISAVGKWYSECG